MTYIATDGGATTGNVIELYEFTLDGGVFHRLTSFDTDYDYSSNSHISTVLRRTEFNSTTDINDNSITLSVVYDNPVVQAIMSAYQRTPTILTIFRGHQDDGEFISAWKGRVIEIVGNGPYVEMKCESVFSSLLRLGLLGTYTRNCGYVLYDEDPFGCGLNKDDFAIAGTTTAVSGSTVLVTEAAGYADGWFTGGLLKDTSGLFAFIVGHVGNNLTLMREVSGLAGSQNITLYPGCDRLKRTCWDKFSNGPRFGGKPHIPLTSGQDGSSVL